MAKKYVFDGELLNENIKELSEGMPKMSALLDAIQQADQEKDAYWQLYFRYQYACEATFHDDPPKAIPVAAEFATIFEENPDVFPEEAAAESYVMITQMGIDPIVNLPYIPKEQWEHIMEQYYEIIQRFGIGLRTYWWQMARFWKYIDKQKAYEYFEKFWQTQRDDISDCEACEHSYGVQMSLLLGDKKAADEYAKPMEEGSIFIWFCNETPHLYLTAYLEDALDKGDLPSAKDLAERLYEEECFRDKSDLSYVGVVLRCWAYTDLDRAIENIPLPLEWSMGMWDQKKVYDFFKGAWICFRELKKRQDTVELKLTRDFPMYQREGVYDCAALEKWFFQQAKEIGERFDLRNGSDYFEKDLALACICENGGIS